MISKILIFLVALTLTSPSLYAKTGEAQDQYEKSIGAVVRQKHFYKAGKFEVAALGGVMPYDSIVNHYMLGAKLSWHLSDHFGWEILDIQKTFPSTTKYTTDLVSAKGITNLQTVENKLIIGTHFLMSPIYGKVRFFGRQILYYDVYLVAGGGFANTDVLRFSTTTQNGAVTRAVVKSGWDPMFDFGFGFKIFTSDTLGIIIDMRDYVISSEVYGKRVFRSNFGVYLGASLFLPWFG